MKKTNKVHPITFFRKANEARQKLVKKSMGGPGDGIAKKASNSTTTTSSTSDSTSTPVKTAADYKAERKALREQGKTEKLKARNENKVERIKNRESGSGLKTAEKLIELTSGMLGIVGAAKKLSNKNNNSRE